MRRIHQQLTEKETLSLLRTATSGVLCLTADDGYPYGVPMSFAFRDGHLYMHTARKGHKVDAIRHSQKASFTVIVQDEIHAEEFTTYFRSVICFGTIRIMDDDDHKLAAARWLASRYSPTDAEGMEREIARSGDAMYMLDFAIEQMTGKEAIELVRQRREK